MTLPNKIQKNILEFFLNKDNANSEFKAVHYYFNQEHEFIANLDEAGSGFAFVTRLYDGVARGWYRVRVFASTPEYLKFVDDKANAELEKLTNRRSIYNKIIALLNNKFNINNAKDYLPYKKLVDTIKKIDVNANIEELEEFNAICTRLQNKINK